MYGQVTRTNAAVEAYNGYMNKCIQAHPSLFVLIKKLIEEEFAKSREFDILLKTANPPQQRRFYRMRDQTIKKMGKLLKEKKITVDAFLNGIVNDANKIFTEKCAFGVGADSAMDSSEPEDEPTPGTVVISGATCVICFQKPSDILLSCGHYKHCLSCFNRLQAAHQQNMDEYRLGVSQDDEEPTFKCPHCNTKIIAHMHVPKILS